MRVAERRSEFKLITGTGDLWGVWCTHVGENWPRYPIFNTNYTQIARFKGPTWGPSGADRTQVAPCGPHELCYLGIPWNQHLGTDSDEDHRLNQSRPFLVTHIHILWSRRANKDYSLPKKNPQIYNNILCKLFRNLYYLIKTNSRGHRLQGLAALWIDTLQ